MRYAIILTSTKTSDITDKIIKAFDPITDLMKGLSYPTCFIMMAAGILLMISGNKHKGLTMAKWAGVGFLLMQFLPTIMQLLVEVGNSMF
jgi:hypothetical protein